MGRYVDGDSGDVSFGLVCTDVSTGVVGGSVFGGDSCSWVPREAAVNADNLVTEVNFPISSVRTPRLPNVPLEDLAKLANLDVFLVVAFLLDPPSNPH